MTRQQKQNTLAITARSLAQAIQQGRKPLFGSRNKGITLTRTGTAYDLVGHLIVLAGMAPRLTIDETDPNIVLALTLGTTVNALPENLQQAVIDLALAGDDTRRSYLRRVPRLVKLLNDFAAVVSSAKVYSPETVAVPPPARNGKIALPGKSI